MYPFWESSNANIANIPRGKYKKLKTFKIIRLNFSDFLSDQYKIMMTYYRILYKNEEVLP